MHIQMNDSYRVTCGGKASMVIINFGTIHVDGALMAPIEDCYNGGLNVNDRKRTFEFRCDLRSKLFLYWYLLSNFELGRFYPLAQVVTPFLYGLGGRNVFANFFPS